MMSHQKSCVGIIEYINIKNILDDVISTAVTGALGSGTASSALRGGVVALILYSKGASASVIIIIKSSSSMMTSLLVKLVVPFD